MAAKTKSVFHKSSNVDVERWVLLRSKNEAAVLYGVWISVQKDWIRLKSSPSANDEMTYLVLVLLKTIGDSSLLNLMAHQVALTRWREEEGMLQDMRRVEDGRMSGE